MWINIWQGVGAVSIVMTFVSFIGFWYCTLKDGIEKDGQISGLTTQVTNLTTDADKKQAKISTLENTSEALRKYSDVAMLDGLGKPFPDGDIVFHSEITDLLVTVVFPKAGTFELKSDASAQAIYQNVIDSNPRFPFAYFYLAYSQKQNNIPDWKDNALKAKSILKMTTLIEGHKPFHDQALGHVQTMLKSEPLQAN